MYEILFFTNITQIQENETWSLDSTRFLSTRLNLIPSTDVRNDWKVSGIVLARQKHADASLSHVVNITKRLKIVHPVRRRWSASRVDACKSARCSSQISRNPGSNRPWIYWIFWYFMVNAIRDDEFDADEPLLLDFRVENVLR